jgi:hypothetical protein
LQHAGDQPIILHPGFDDEATLAIQGYRFEVIERITAFARGTHGPFPIIKFSSVKLISPNQPVMPGFRRLRMHRCYHQRQDDKYTQASHETGHAHTKAKYITYRSRFSNKL